MEWCVFWICLFSYWSIKESVSLITYNKRRALKDAIRKEYGNRIAELVAENVTEDVDEVDDDIVEEIYEQLENFDNKEK